MWAVSGGKARPPFPSEEHYRELAKKGFKGRTGDEDLKYWHAYDYGWRRIMLHTRDDRSPIDPNREWFDADLADKAEIFYCRKFGKPCPPRVKAPWPPRPRTQQELDYVDACMREIRANLAKFDESNRAVITRVSAGTVAEGEDELRRVRDALGVTATEVTAPAVDDNTAAELDDTDAVEEAGISLLITQAQKAELRCLGYSDEEIRAMTPADAHRILGLR